MLLTVFKKVFKSLFKPLFDVLVGKRAIQINDDIFIKFGIDADTRVRFNREEFTFLGSKMSLLVGNLQAFDTGYYLLVGICNFDIDRHERTPHHSPLHSRKPIVVLPVLRL